MKDQLMTEIDREVENVLGVKARVMEAIRSSGVILEHAAETGGGDEFEKAGEAEKNENTHPILND